MSNARMGVNVNRMNVIGEILRRFGLSRGGGLRPGIILLDPPTWCEPRWYMYVYVYMCMRDMRVPRIAQALREPAHTRGSAPGPGG